MPQEARSSSRGRTSRARSQRALHVSDTSSPHSHASSEVDVSAVQPKVAKAALGNFFESVFESASKKSSDDQSRGAYSTVSKMAASKKSHRSSEPREKNSKAKEKLGSFFDDVKSKKEPKEDDDQSRGAYSTVSKMQKSGSRRRSRSRNGKDRLPSRKPSSKESSSDKKAEALGLGSFIQEQTPVDVEQDIEVQSAQVGSVMGSVSSRRSRSRSGRDRLSSRKKREAPQPVANGKNGAASREEMLALFRTVSSPTDYTMTDQMRHEVGPAENWSSRIANEDKVLGYSKEKTRTSDMKDTRARSSDEGDINQERGETNDRSIATLIKGVRARSSLSNSTPPVTDERKTQTTRRTSQSSNRTPPKTRTRSKSRSRRPSNRERSKSRSRMNNDESTSDALKSPRPKSRSRVNIDESTSDALKSPRPKSRSSRQSDESGSDAIKSPRKSGSRRNSSFISGSDAIKSPRPKSGSRRNSTESSSEAMRMYKKSTREAGPSSKDSGRRHKDHKDAPRQKSSRHLADDEGDPAPPQRQKSSRRLVEESPRRQASSRHLAEGTPRRQPSSRRLVAKDSPKKSSRSAHEESEGAPRRSKHSSSKRPSNENPSTHSSSRHLSNEERSIHSSSRRLSNEERSNHSSSRRPSNEDPSSPTSSAKIETHKLSNHQRHEAPILEDEVEHPANYFEQDIFSLYTWSSARTDTQRIQKERKKLKDSLRDSPLFRVFPQ